MRRQDKVNKATKSAVFAQFRARAEKLQMFKNAQKLMEQTRKDMEAKKVETAD